MRMQAVFKGTVIAESDDTVVVEGNHYFPVDSIKPEFFSETDTQTRCHWKGIASYYDVAVGDESSTDAAWYYPDPKPRAESITGRIAFWRGVHVVPAEA